MAFRGLYGQAEGNESRRKDDKWAERLRENELAEGNWQRPMIDAAKEGNMREMERLRNSMKKRYIAGGVAPVLAQERADSCLRQAMAFLKV